MTKRTLKQYEKMFEKINREGVITEGEINRIKNGLSRGCPELFDIVTDNLKSVYNITQEQTIKGLNYLKRHYLTSRGKQRQNALTRDVDVEFLNFIKEIEKDNSKFTFNGFKQLTNGFWNYYAPIYSIHLNGFTYSYFHFLGKDYEYSTSNIGKLIYCYDF